MRPVSAVTRSSISTARRGSSMSRRKSARISAVCGAFLPDCGELMDLVAAAAQRLLADGRGAAEALSSDASVALLNDGRLTERRLSRGAAARRSASSGVCFTREVVRATRGSAAARRGSRRGDLKSCERSARRASEASAVSRAFWMKRTTSSRRSASLPITWSELALRSRMIVFWLARIWVTLRSWVSAGAPSRIASLRLSGLPASAVPNSLMISGESLRGTARAACSGPGRSGRSARRGWPGCPDPGCPRRRPPGSAARPGRRR